MKIPLSPTFTKVDNPLKRRIPYSRKRNQCSQNHPLIPGKVNMVYSLKKSRLVIANLLGKINAVDEAAEVVVVDVVTEVAVDVVVAEEVKIVRQERELKPLPKKVPQQLANK